MQFQAPSKRDITLAAVCGLGALVFIGWLASHSPHQPPSAEQERQQKLEQDRSAWVYTSVGVALRSIKHALKDADSAKFRSVGVIVSEPFDSSKAGVVCGEVNAKNSFGGYTGFKEFVMVPAGIAIEGTNPEFTRLWNAHCAGKPIRYLPDERLPD